MLKLTNENIEILIRLIKEEQAKLVLERKINMQEADPVIEPQPGQKRAIKPQVKKPVVKHAPKPVQKPRVSAPVRTVKTQSPAKVQAPVKKAPKTPEQQKLDAERSRPEKPTVNSDKISRIQYQIFATKLAMSRLDVKILAAKFTESLHDFDSNVSKNDKDPQKITAYALPVIGNIEALKNASEALQIEFNKLKALIDQASTGV
jgi:hypothetical protein